MVEKARANGALAEHDGWAVPKFRDRSPRTDIRDIVRMVATMYWMGYPVED